MENKTIRNIGVIAMQEKSSLSQTELYAEKFKIIRDVTQREYEKYQKRVGRAKIITTVVFLIFTVFEIAVSRATGNVTLWLSIWIVLIFIIVFSFIFLEFKLHIFSEKIIPYLNDERIVEFDTEFDYEDTEDNEE